MRWVLEVSWPNPQFRCFVHSVYHITLLQSVQKDLSVIAAKCSHAIYVARDCVHWDSKKSLLQLSYQEGKQKTKAKVAKSDILSLSEHQLQHIQENKMKALAKLASKLYLSLLMLLSCFYKCEQCDVVRHVWWITHRCPHIHA